MKSRLFTGIIGGLILGISTYLGGIFFYIVYFFIASLCLLELSKAFKQKVFESGYYLNLILNLVFLIIAIFKKDVNIAVYATLTLFVYISINLFFYAFLNVEGEKIFVNLLGGLYISFFLFHLYLLNDTLFVWYIYIIAFSNDTFAYFTGKLIGKHKLSPKLSPKKTIEGAIGGIFGSVVVALIYNYFVGNYNTGIILLFIITASIFSISGDLVASKIKRHNKIKDYSNFLPGHGGFLDRFDSMILIVPIIYYFSVFIN
jgi:phosphatidate cytidylyltransferase